MATWQKKARLLIAVAAIAFAIAVGVAFRPRTPETPAAAATPSDPKAVVEAAGGETLRWNRDKEEVRTDYEKLLTYQDGTTKLLGVKVTTTRAGGRTFTLTAKEGLTGQNEAQFEVTGDVQLTASDGLQLLAERATYLQSEGIVRVPGPVKFSRGRMRGTGVGLTYDKTRDVATIHEEVVIHIDPQKGEATETDITAGFAELNRQNHSIRFEGLMKAKRSGQTLESDTANAYLTADEDRLERLELRGHARIGGSSGGAGSLESLAGRDIDLTYAADGSAIEHAVIVGDAAMRIAGDSQGSEASQGRAVSGSAAAGVRQITAQHIDVTLTADGTTPTALSARDGVQLLMPPDKGGAGRTITAQSLVASGERSGGLTKASFTGDVRYREQGPDIDRIARAATLDAALAPGLSSFEDATFRRGVRFEEGEMTATAASARYVLGAGTLDLTGSEPGAANPRVVNDRLSVDASHISVVLEGPRLKAVGSVRSTIRPAAPDGREGRKGETRLPSMLKDGQPVHVTAHELGYDGEAATATYTGAARLSQGDTSIKADSITLDEKTGDLVGSGSVATAAVLLQDAKDAGQPKERVNTLASAKDFRYEEAQRRATYTGDAHVSGPQGDMTAPRIELYLKPEGDELERVEAYDGVTLREQNRVTTGTRMTYFSADERYVVGGTPLKVVDQCGRETTGRTLTFFKATDRIVIDGSEQRTQTKGGSNCK